MNSQDWVKAKDYKIGICWFTAKHTALRRKSKKTGWLGIRVMCPSGATCLPADCCFSEIAPNHHFIERSLVLAMI